MSNFEMNFAVNDCDGNLGEKKCNPCCSICCGLILIIVAPFVIWNTEGDYVKTLKALDAAGKSAIEPCTFSEDGSCNDCKVGDLKNGDLVFFACSFSNMRTLSALATEDKSFDIDAIRPAVGGLQKAVAFRWTAEMYQWRQTRGDDNPLQMAFDAESDCPAASRYDDDNDSGATKRRALCCQPGKVGYIKFQRKYYGKGRICKPWQGAPMPKIEEGRLQAEMATDLSMVFADGDAAKETAATPSANMALAETEDMEDEDLLEDEDDDLDHESILARRLLRGPPSSDSRRRTIFTCNFPCYDWQLTWTSKAEPDPKAWAQLPSEIPEVGYLPSAAGNLNLPFSGSKGYLENTQDSVKIGGLTLSGFKPVTNKLSYISSTTQQVKGTGGEDLTIGASSQEKWKGMNYTSYTRENDWTSKEANAQQNCLVSRRSTGYKVGDLRICFERADITEMSVIAAVKQGGAGPELVVSKDHLRADTAMRIQDQGFRMRKNSIISLEQMLAEEKGSNESLLYAGRIIGPIILWLAFYCCLQPIVWLVDKCGDSIDGIPCVGGCLGLLADFVETLVGILICIVSCCLGLGCGLFAMACAWLYYRPLIGTCLLVVSLCFFAAVAYYAYSTRDPNKGRRRSSARQPTVGAAVELREGNVQPAAAMPMAAVAVPQPQLFQVQCPQGCAPGSQILVTTPDGRQVSVQVPAGVSPGQMFQVQA